jgi:N-acetylglucosaminyl-diphospho-decaprenol L-rhamnosyltransferase
MKVLAIVVNYRTAKMTLAAVRALLAALEDVPGAEVVIVDNDSQDGSFEILSEAARTFGREGLAPVEVIATKKNGGFGYGVNAGVRHGLSPAGAAASRCGTPGGVEHPEGLDFAASLARDFAASSSASSVPDFFYLLNSDAFPDPSAVRELLRFFARHPRAGIAGSYVYGEDGHPHQTAFRFPSPIGEFERALRLGVASKLLGRWRVPLPLPDLDREVDWVAGASMMIRREVFEDVGFFDETFFLYFEETDFCRRARLRGWSTYYVRGSAVAHIGGASTGIKDSRSTRRMPSYWFDSRRHYFRKNHGEVGLAMSDLLFALGFSLWRLRRKLQNKPDEDPPLLLRDFIRHALRARAPQP